MLAPLDPGARGQIVQIVQEYLRCRGRGRTSCVQSSRHCPRRNAPNPGAHDHYATSVEPGAVVMRLLANRNLGWTDIAKIVYRVTGRYWSAATYGGVGVGRVELTPDLLGDLGVLLNIPTEDLAALTGTTPTP